MYNLLSKNILLSFFIALIIAICVGIQLFGIADSQIILYSKVPLLNFLVKEWGITAFKFKLFFYIFNLIIAFYLAYLLADVKISNIFNFVPSIIYLIHVSLGLKTQLNVEILIQLIFLGLATHFISLLLKEKKSVDYFFASGFVIGFLVVLQYSYFVYFVFYLIIIYRFQTSGIRDLLAFIIGVVTMLFILFCYLYVGDKLSYVSSSFLMDLGVVKIKNSGWSFVFCAIVFIEWLAFSPKVNVLNISNRKLYFFFLIMFFSTIIIAVLRFFEGENDFLNLSYFGGVYLSSLVITNKSKKINNIILILILLGFLINFAIS
jgi:hypothetical protein